MLGNQRVQLKDSSSDIQKRDLESYIRGQ